MRTLKRDLFGGRETGKSQGNHKKIIGKSTKIIMAIFGPNTGEMYLNNTSIALLFFSASIWYNKIPISLFEKPETLIFMISGFLDLLLIAFIGQSMALLANEWFNSYYFLLINITFGYLMS